MESGWFGWIEFLLLPTEGRAELRARSSLFWVSRSYVSLEALNVSVAGDRDLPELVVFFHERLVILLEPVVVREVDPVQRVFEGAEAREVVRLAFAVSETVELSELELRVFFLEVRDGGFLLVDECLGTETPLGEQLVFGLHLGERGL